MEYFNVIIKEINDAFRVLTLDRGKTEIVSHKRDATYYGIGFLVFPVIVNLLLSAFLFPSGFGAIFSRFLFWPMMIPAVSLVIVIFAITIATDKIFGVKVDFLRFFRVLSYASLCLWLTILPFLLDILHISLGYGLYNLLWIVAFAFIMFIGFQILTLDYRLSQKNAIICIAGGIIGYFLVNLILGNILVGSYYRIFY